MRLLWIFVGCIIMVFPLYGISIEEAAENWRYFVLKPSLGAANPSFPGLFEQIDSSLRDIDYHITSMAEFRALQTRAKEAALDNQQSIIFDIRQKLDALLFNDVSRLKNNQTRRTLQRELKKAQRDYDALNAIDAQSILVRDTRTVERIEDIDTLVISDRQQIAYYAELLAKENNFQQVFYITAEALDDYRIVSVFVFNGLTKIHEKLTELVVETQEFVGLADSIILPIVEELRGQQVSELRILAFSEGGDIEYNADIRIDDESKGFGEFHSRFFPSGQYSISVHFPNRQVETKSISLLSKEARTVQFFARAGEDDTVKLISVPPGARVYQNSLYLGLTPLEVQRPTLSHHVLMQLDAYYDAWTVLKPESSDIVSIALLSKRENLESELQKRRRRFYSGLAILAATIPLPIVFSALYQERESFLDSPNLSASARAENLQLYQGYYYTFWASLGITLSATGYMATRLGQYLHYANNMAEDWMVR